MAIAIVICRYSYVFGVGGSNITGEINYSPLHSVLQIQRGIQYFKGAQIIISENFVLGGPKISTKMK